MDQNFPVYCKYAGHQTWFKITSDESFEEIRILGEFYNIHDFKAVNFLDRHLIQDMIAGKGENWAACTEKEYQEVKENCLEKLKKNNAL